MADSILFLKTDLNNIGKEYIKFKELYNAYKHGCRLLHPETVTMEEEDFVACIMYLTKETSKRRGGKIDLIGFSNEDFSFYFTLIETINRILGVVFHNRKERYLFANRLSDNISIAIYFPRDIEDLYTTAEVEFII